MLRRLLAAIILVASLAVSPARASDGLTAAIYATPTFSGRPAARRVDRSIDFDWRSAPAAGVDLSSFSIRWIGQIEGIEDGNYEIKLESSGGVRLWIDGQSIIYNWKQHAATSDSGAISLKSGRKYDLRMQYYHASGPAVLKLSWKRPGASAFEIIPQSQLFSEPNLVYTASSIANTGGLPSQLDDATVWPDGTVYAVGSAGDSGFIFSSRDGQLFARQDAPGASAIAADVGYLYASAPVSRAAAGGVDWSGSGIRRFVRSELRPAPFENGQGKDGDFWELNTDKSAPCSGGLAVSERFAELYIADPSTDDVKVFSTLQTTQFPLRRWEFDRPHRLCIDKGGNIWVSRRAAIGKTNTPGAVVCFNPKGQRLKSINDVSDPTALAVDSDGHLLVADNDQVRIYDIIDQPKLLQTFGESIFSGKTPGLSGEKRFAGIVGIGTDAHGNLYIAQNGIGPHQHAGENWADADPGAIIESYNIDSGRRNWAAYGLGGMEVPDFDPAGEGDIYTPHHHLKLDLSQPAGKQWSDFAQTCNPAKYPHDARLGDNSRRGMVYMRRLGDQRIMYTVDPIGGKLCIYRFTDGELAVPSGVFVHEHYTESHAILGRDAWPPNQPAQNGSIWRDLNGDGRMDAAEYLPAKRDADATTGPWWPDSNGDIWTLAGAKIRRFRMLGFDKFGNPTYDFGAVEDFDIPKPLSSIQRIACFPESDTLFLSGYTADSPDAGGPWGRIGNVICRYDGWTKARKLALSFKIPTGDDLAPVALAVAGDCVFVQYLRHMECRVYDAKTGTYIGMLEPRSPLPEDQADSAGEMRDHLRAIRRSDGEYLVLVGDRRYAHTVLYRFRPPKQ